MQVIAGALLTDVGFMESQSELKRGSRRSSRGLSEGRLAMSAHDSVRETEKNQDLEQNSYLWSEIQTRNLYNTNQVL